ncbi:hypothetical protein [Acetobacter papayae]|uniref:hypothetical protein n=1 Tax=Acetobacter papayae TaxID=1076592 RepID=UPI0019016DCA|nr:hypothetical protein [Acetobacter papayae]
MSGKACHPIGSGSGTRLELGGSGNMQEKEGKIKHPATSGDKARSRFVFWCAGSVGRVQGFGLCAAFLRDVPAQWGSDGPR